MQNAKAMIRVLHEHIAALKRAKQILERSYQKCRSIAVPFPVENDDTLEAIEALTARFARAADILTQRVGKSLAALLREDAPTVIDRMHLLEKLGAIASAETLILIRDVRNEIAHEYTDEGVQKVFEKCMPLVPQLLEAIDSAVRYAERTMEK